MTKLTTEDGWSIDWTDFGVSCRDNILVVFNRSGVHSNLFFSFAELKEKLERGEKTIIPDHVMQSAIDSVSQGTQEKDFSAGSGLKLAA